jgi:uncharacterized membrane protein required for colicin V production
MSALDAALILLAMAGCYVGMKIGVVSGTFDILAGWAGCAAASRFHGPVSHFLGEEPARGYVLIFLATAGALVGTGIYVSHALESFFLGLMDRFLGALLGMLLSLTLAASLLFPPLLARRPGFMAHLQKSPFAASVMRSSQRFLRVAPAALWEKLEPTLEPSDVHRVRRLLELSN